MYRDAQEELKRLEEALLEEDGQEDISQWDLDEALSDIPDLPKKKEKKKKSNRSNIITALTAAVIILTATMAGLMIYVLAGYGRWFS